MPINSRMDSKAVSVNTGKEQTTAHNTYNFTNVASSGRSQPHKSTCRIILFVLNNQEKLIYAIGREDTGFLAKEVTIREYKGAIWVLVMFCFLI